MTELVQAAYIHVPFCIHRCGYCDFTVIARRDDLIDVFLDCLEREIKNTLEKPQPVQTLFIGGGTPNYLPAEALQRLLDLLAHWMPVADDGEFSMECNPEMFTLDRMDVMALAGVNRVSLGVQSFHATHLRTLERKHTAEEVFDVVECLREREFQNISIDLIYAVPGETLAEWQEDLQMAVNMKPQHLSTYGLTFEKGTSFWTRRSKQQLSQVADEIERDMYAAAMDDLKAAGYVQYELSNSALPGFECRHNQVYWNAEPYYGFGPGAASFLFGERAMRHRSVTRWIKHIRAGESAIADREELTPDLRAREAVMLGLRKTGGINAALFHERHGKDVRDLAPAEFDQFVTDGLLELTDGQVRLTYDGRFLADTVVAAFL